MPFKNKKRRLAYAAQWRAKHPSYMRDYYKNITKRFDPRRIAAPPSANSASVHF